jgi:hypothetical protein
MSMKKDSDTKRLKGCASKKKKDFVMRKKRD